MKPVKLLTLAAVMTAISLTSGTVLAGGDDNPYTITSVPRNMSYQGILKDSAGDPVDDSVYSITFRIFNVASGGTSMWDETLPCTTTAGVFTATFSNVSLPFDEDYWLEIEIASEILDPRQKMGMVGYAAVSDTADFAQRVATIDWATGGTVFGDVNIQSLLNVFGDISVTDKATIGSGHTNTGENAFVAGESNTASGDYSTIAGGRNNEASFEGSAVGGGNTCIASNQYSVVAGGNTNTASGGFSAVGGGVVNIASGLYSCIPGGQGNTVNNTHSVVGGGESNISSGEQSTVGGGKENTASGNHATVAGGYNNVASDLNSTVGGGISNEATAYAATVGGGRWNMARGEYSVVGGGGGYNSPDSNLAGGDYSVVGGGRANIADSLYSTIGGGYGNTAGGVYSTIGGGTGNITYNFYSSVCGGVQNTAGGSQSSVGGGFGNGAYGARSTISGGWYNTINGDQSTVCGGYNNSIDGLRSCILGGYSNDIGVDADYSLAFGRAVSIDSSFQVVFFDGTYSGRFGLNRDEINGGISHPIHVGTSASNGNGAHLTAGGTWTNGSSHEFKENFKVLDPDELIDKIFSLDITSWNYIDSDEKHIGPMAEDFVSAFDVGTIRESDGQRENQYLAAGDVAGIALAGIQALLDKIEELEKRIAELEAERK